ncbi:hypothetical protein KC887_10430, partial [Candidatus Kaiserbacteria bacterium]|nr:hypothetical protein [Candidatus Kaiserbacteria bacterium]
MISDMAIEIDGVEYLFMADALVFAGERGDALSASYVARCARDGRIAGAKKIGGSKSAPWLLPKESFVEWFNSRREPGRPKEDQD